VPVTRLLPLLFLLLATGALAAGRPVLVLNDLDGKSHSLEELRGSVVVVNFWATWCIPCRKEMPILSRVQYDYAGRNVRVIGAATHPIEEAAKVRRAAKKLELTFDTWIGATTRDMMRLGLGTSLPATAVYDRDGQLVARVAGVVSDAKLRKILDGLLARGGRNVGGKVTDFAGEHDHDHHEGDGHDHGDAHGHDEGQSQPESQPQTAVVSESGEHHQHQAPEEREHSGRKPRRRPPASLVPS
jgi:thiol-disulfide isomerase/thioredoxin